MDGFGTTRENDIMRMRLAAFVFAWAGIWFVTGCAGPAQKTRESSPEPLASSRKAEVFDLQAHAGGKGWVFPGNVLPAFEYALDLQVTTLELDMNYTKDGVIIVIHDRSIPKEWHVWADAQWALPPDPSQASPAELAIKNLTLEQIRNYRCPLAENIREFPGRSPNTKLLTSTEYCSIPTLEEVFQFVRDYASSEYKTKAQRENAAKVHFNIETKTRGFEQQVVDTVKMFGLEDRVMVQSFDHRSIATISKIDPEIRTSALDGIPSRIVRDTKAAIWSPRYPRVNAENVKEAHDLGLLVIPWTVDNPEDMENLIDLGVDGIITNVPDVLQEILIERGISFAPR